jgi:phospholipid/cholesterol/gamma-HCH transport system substrate-binding protein
VEIRARYLQIGVFTLIVMVAGFAFVYWLNNAGALRDRVVYRLRFEGSVSGLQRGSAVLFNGVRVGEVTSLKLDPGSPRRVEAVIAVNRDTPVGADTTVSIDFQGLTGSPVVALAGGTSKQRLVSDGEPPLLSAGAAGQHSMIGNLETFSGALARNSDRLDGIVAGLERMTGGATAKARLLIYDLTALRAPEPSAVPSSLQLVIPDPSALAALDSERIQTITVNGVYASVPDAQWSDSLPKVLQMKLLRSLEDAGRFAGVSRPFEGVTSDTQLLLDIRRFEISPSLTAEVEIGCKLIGENSRIIATRAFRASAPVGGPGAPAAVSALDQAFAQAGAQLLSWAALEARQISVPRSTSGKRSSGD